LVYRNLRRVEKATGCVFLVLHHQGWTSDRERGSAAIRDKSDILVQITELNIDAGYIKFTHHKRRGGARVKEFAYELKMHTVEMCLQPVPIVTGKTVNVLLTEDLAADEGHARDLVRIVVAQPKPSVSWTELLKLSKKTRSTFKRGLKEAVDGKGWLTRSRGAYALNPDRSWEAALTVGPSPGPRPGPRGPIPLREGIGPTGPYGQGPPDPTGPKVDPGPNIGEEPATEPIVNEVELKAAELLKKVVP
jgi:hypothetical protein